MSHIHHECELERHIVEQLEAAGWLVGKSADYDQGRALFPRMCWAGWRTASLLPWTGSAP